MTKSDPSTADGWQRESLFDVLRQAIKVRGLSYANLASNMGVSEVTIKRLFADKDCKLSRLMQLCQAAGISFAELVEMQQRRQNPATYLSLDTEKRLAAKPVLFTFLVLLISRFDATSQSDRWGISEATYYQYLRELEKLGIVSVGNNNNFSYTVPLPIRWRLDGPLADIIIDANSNYLRHALEQDHSGDYAVALTSRLMSAHSAQAIKQGLQELQQQFDYLATQDQLFFEPSKLELHKLVGVMGPFPITLLFPPDELTKD